jgi:putative peptide zinc metalloprotease protein
VAVAFQSIFILTDSGTLIPQNRAVAANYNCVRCETTAIAVQFVATLTEMPSAAAMAELEKVWEDLAELEDNVEKIPLDDVYEEIGRIEEAIVKILVDDGVLVIPGDDAVDAQLPAPLPTDGGSAEATPTDPDATPGIDGSDGTTAEPEEEGTDDPTPEPSSDPSSTPTEEPTSEPSEQPSSEPSEEPSPEEEPSPTP